MQPSQLFRTFVLTDFTDSLPEPNMTAKNNVTILMKMLILEL